MIQLPSTKDIHTLENGIIPVSLSGTPFCIIHESIKVPFLSDCAWAWNIFITPRRKDSVEISPSSARRIIRNLKMKPAYQADCGQIYEVDGNPFQKKFRNNKKIKDELYRQTN